MIELIDAWQGKRILVSGDPGYDVYHWCTCERISPEAPVPVLVEQSMEDRPGLAYNVCQNLAALGCIPVQDFPPEPWTIKRRFMVGRQQMMRVDYDRMQSPTHSPPDLSRIDAIILSDYAKGWLTYEYCQALIGAARAKNIPVIVDPKKKGWEKFHGCTVICPNESEWGSKTMDPLKAWPYDNALVKRGERGIRLYEEGQSVQDFPATARHVYDVTGAGDCVVAVVGATLAAGGGLPDAARLANLAGGFVVSEVGTTACSAERLKALCS